MSCIVMFRLFALTVVLATYTSARTRTTRGCGGVVYKKLGELQSPSFPNNTPAPHTCTWTVISPNQRERIRVTFSHFDLAGGECKDNYIIIRDGASFAAPLLGKFCGGRIPPAFWSTNNRLWIHYASNGERTSSGFLLKYVSLPSKRYPIVRTPETTDPPEINCGGFFDKRNGSIASPGYPENYSPNQYCRWIIEAKPYEQIELKLESIGIEYHTRCQYDYLLIKDSVNPAARELLRACGHSLENVGKTFRGHKFVIEFRSDAAIASKGFILNWKTVGKQDVGSEKQDNAVEKQIDGVERRYDVVEKQDGGVEKQDGAEESTKRDLESVGKECRYEQSGFLGSITSDSYPENYNNSLSCEWLLRSALSTKIQLRITDFQLEKSHTCKFDFLEVHDGLTRDAPLLGRFCADKYPDLLTSSSNKMYLYFETDDADTYRGFEATWLALNGRVVEEDNRSVRKLSKRSKIYKRQVNEGKCGEVFTSKTGVLTSPYYPNNYPPDSTCYWTIKSDQFHQIILTFNDFEMEQHSNCRYDFLKVSDGETKDARVVGEFCGRNSPNVVRAETDTLRLELISDSTAQRKGFNASWRWERKESVSPSDCGGVFTGETGIVTSPNYPDSEERPYICVWSIRVPDGGRVRFEFNDVNITKYPGCGRGYVQLNDGKTREDPNLGVFCGTTVPGVITSSRNSLCIGYLADGSGKMEGFKGKWTTVYGTPTQKPPPKQIDTTCEEVFFGQTGQIVRYTGITNCTWTIKVPADKNIIISFAHLKMLQDPDCRREQIEIRDGADSSDPLLMRGCGELQPHAVRSSTNQVLIRHIVKQALRSTRVKIFWKTIDVGKPSDVFDEVACGVSSIGSIAAGDEGALPWTVGIMGLFNRAHCGGAILTPNWIVTAAHCFERLPWTVLWTVRAGEYDMMTYEGTEQNRKIRQIIIHPEYDPISYDNDIALLRLDQPLTLTTKVKSVCLPPIEMSLPPGRICPIAGWGTDRYLSQKPSGPLVHILPEIKSTEECNESYNGKVTNNMICAGGDGLDSCQGDGGSPLSCVDDDGRYYVVGLSSWGNGCAFPGRYGVYTDVRRKVEWIKETVANSK